MRPSGGDLAIDRAAVLSEVLRNLEVMASIALVRSVLGMRPGLLDVADGCVNTAHQVLAIDQYDTRVFDAYTEADTSVEEVGGYPELMTHAVDAVRTLSYGFICVGSSNGGGGMSEYVAAQHRVAGVVMCSGALPLQMIGVEAWPARVPARIHSTSGGPPA